MADNISTYMKYEGVLNICDQMNTIIKDIDTNLITVKELINNKDSIWMGEAANRYWNGLTKGKDVNTLEYVEDITKNKIPTSITSVRNLVSANQNLDASLTESNKIGANDANDNVNANNAVTDATGVDTELNNRVDANDNIQGNTAQTLAQGVATELNNKVNASDNINANSATTLAQGVATELNNSVGIDGEILSNNISTTAKGVATNLNDKVGLQSAIGTEVTNIASNKTVDSIISDFENLIKNR